MLLIYRMLRVRLNEVNDGPVTLSSLMPPIKAGFRVPTIDADPEGQATGRVDRPSPPSYTEGLMALTLAHPSTAPGTA